LFKGTLHQDPERLHRIEPRIFVRVRPSSRFLDSCALLASHPLRSPRESFFLSKGRSTATRYPFALKSALRLLSGLAGEILLSDFCNQLSDTSTREPLDSRVEGSRLPTRCSLHCSATKTPCGSSVSGGGRLDGAPPTSAVSLTALPRKNRPQSGHFAAALSTACEADDRPLAFPFASRFDPGFPGGHQNTRTAAHLVRVNETGLFGPERLLSPSAWRSALRFLPDPPPCPRFRHRGAGFRSVFTTQRSRVEQLGAVPGAFASMTFRVARRLSRSAIVTIREHDHETAQTRSPCRQSPACTALLTDDLSITREPTVAARSFEARPAEVSPVRGWRRSSYQRLLPRSLATRALPRPDPLEHLLSRDRRSLGLETQATRSVFGKEHTSRSHQRGRLAPAPH
jgi:hypothetical protein